MDRSLPYSSPYSSPFQPLDEKAICVLLDNVKEVIFQTDAQGLWQFLNPAWTELTGYEVETSLATPFLDYVHPDDRDANQAEFLPLIRRQKDFCRHEVRYLQRDGGCRWVEVYARLKLSEAGEVLGTIGTLFDVSERKRVETELRASDARYRSFIENTTEGVYSFETAEPVPVNLPADEQIEHLYQGRIVACNDALARMYGYPDAQALMGVTLAELHGGADRPENIAFLREWIQAGYRISQAESHETDVAGHDIWFSNSVVGVVEAGQLVRVWGSQTDITERKRAEERLRLAASVFENTAEGVIITDPAGTILDVNRAFSDITGYAKAEVTGRNPSVLKSGHHDGPFYATLWRSLLEAGLWRGEIWNRRKDGSIYPAWLTISQVLDAQGEVTHYVGVFSDVSRLKQSQAKLEYLAKHDALTDLPNRLLLTERLEQAIRHCQRREQGFALIFLDLDHFKHINDSFGHPAGDQLLHEVARRVVGSVRQDDTVARVGGDEFVVLLENLADPHKVANLACQLIRDLNAPLVLEQRDIRITASLGICTYPTDGADASTLMRNADAAMYRAKDRGRNTYEFYTEELTRNAFERVLLENNLRQALEQDQLSLLYQPQVALPTGRTCGVEALLRWWHPELGPISPVRFIPLAEECGLIFPIGQWVLRMACRQASEWLSQGLAFGRIAVNVAGPQIQRGGLADSLATILKETGLPADRLELEITESFIMQEAESAINELNALRALGVQLAIDDFGTGYSSLSYLKRLPIDKLKIDKSFIQDIPTDSNDAAITSAILAMAHNLDLAVIAEGVETAAQAEFLHAQGCREVQGYYFAKPLAAADFAQFAGSEAALTCRKR